MSNGLKTGIDEGQCVRLARDSGWLWTQAREIEGRAAATLLLAHGAGAPMDSDFMNEMAQCLAAEGVSVMRFEFPYMAQRRDGGSKRPPNVQAQLLDCWREVYARLRPCVAGRLAIGGKSMGGRMASLLADELAADALVCLGYPFHPAGKPEKTRTEHLAQLRTPTLIVQGERDPLGTREDVAGYSLSSVIDIQWVPTANHDLKPLKAAGVSHGECLRNAAHGIAQLLARAH